jgi:hypothetical protein
MKERMTDMGMDDPRLLLVGMTIFGLAAGWLMNIFRHGKKIGRQDRDISHMEDRLGTVELKQKSFEQQWRIERDKFRELIEANHHVIESYFWDSDKNPRILTVSQHEKICGRREKDMQDIKGHVESIFKSLDQLGRDVAVISDRFDSSRRGSL